jgi:8-oxo-dGTP diphosphatase
MDRFALVPAAYLLLTRGDASDLEVLLQLRGPETTFMSGHWAAAAAGHVEPGESVFDAAAREAAEEIGIVLDAADIRALCAMQRTLPGVADPVEQRVDFFLTVERWQGEPTILEPGKCAALAWHRLDALPDRVVPHERHVLELLRHGAVPPVLAWGF